MPKYELQFEEKSLFRATIEVDKEMNLSEMEGTDWFNRVLRQRPDFRITGVMRRDVPQLISLSKVLTVSAEIHSDDHAVSVTFDATDWFEVYASFEELRALVKCGFGGDYPADEVARWACGSGNVDKVFTYIEARLAIGDTMGFECHINEKEALAWLRAKQPDVLKEETDPRTAEG